MNYLLYYIEGFIKKFPLDKGEITIGRSSDNDLVMKEHFISRNHVRILTHADHITVKDLASTNGITVGDEKVNRAQIRLNQSFVLGKIEFFLKHGPLEEFQLADELVPIFDTMGQENETRSEDTATCRITDIHQEILKIIMQVGLKKNHLSDFLLSLPRHLPDLEELGSLLILSTTGRGHLNVLLSLKDGGLAPDFLEKVAADYPDMFTRARWVMPLPGHDAGARLRTQPLNVDGNGESMVIVFVGRNVKEKEVPKMESFLARMAAGLELLLQLWGTPEKDRGKGRTVDAGAEPADGGIVIMAENRRMKELISQARKIAGGDIFVLIQGESGTGKELFARLIHHCSSRRDAHFIALNCAAIPEDLLESELFGHEKGAFTGAHAQKKGKLEIASGGTLVLDEIGDMPINLQAKLLRALQEKEFYRLGGSHPIKVDLRVISITNQDLNRLIGEGKFREDLYYRLVHRVLTIPPLRERKDDITPLINYFTHKFCHQTGKRIGGYSLKACRTLQDYPWKGNVRQLENEIRSIINLVDNGETVGYDILSEAVKGEIKDDIRSNDIQGNGAGDCCGAEVLPERQGGEPEKDFIFRLLEKNRGNKSRTARDLGMTYQGLHKKMKKWQPE